MPKTFLPGYKEYYEERWFSSSREARAGEIRLAGAAVPFGTDLLFQVPEEPGVALAVEICEDLWAPDSSELAPRGGRGHRHPRTPRPRTTSWARPSTGGSWCASSRAALLSAYVYANAGVHESTTDLVFGGHLMVAENGVLLAEGERFRRDGDLMVTDVDIERLRVERAAADVLRRGRPGGGRPAYR